MKIIPLLIRYRLFPGRLSTQLIVIMSLLAVMSMTAFTLYSIDNDIAHQTKSLQNQAQVLAKNIASASSTYIITRDYTSIESMLIDASEFNSILQIQITDEKGKAIGDVIKKADGSMEPVYGSKLQVLPDSAIPQTTQDDKKLYVWHPIILGDYLGWVHIIYSKKEIELAETRIWQDNLVIGFTLIVVTILLLAIMLRRPMKTIESYTDFTIKLDDMTGEQVDVGLESLETKKLGIALNHVSERLSQQRNQLINSIENLERLAAFPEYSPNLVISLTPDIEVCYHNTRCNQLLLSIGMEQQDINHLLPKDMDNITKRVIQNGEHISNIEVLVNDRILSWDFAPVRGQSIFHGYGIDITERREAEQLAQIALVDKLSAIQANKAKSHFLANMSHELRTPLNAIIGYSEILQEEALEEENTALEEDLKKIHTAGKHLFSLINDILDLSKIEAGKMDVFLEFFDIRNLLNDVITTVEPLTINNNNTLTLNMPDSLPGMRSDTTKIRQVLINLLSNSLKFTKNGNVSLNVSFINDKPSEHIQFSVQDTGIGMNQKQLEHVFNAFTQADSSTTREYGGTGLGLSISKKFCQMLGGDIEVESKPNEGSIFTVTLPLTTVKPSETPEDKQDNVNLNLKAQINRQINSQSNYNQRKKVSTILVIDDDPNVRELLERSLVKDGFNVQTAPNGKLGLDKAKAIKPDVITLDVMMPGMDGWDVLRKLKADPDLSDVPVAMLTLLDEKGIGQSLGADEYLQKPIDWNQLSKVIKKWVRKRQSNKIIIVDNDDMNRQSVSSILKESNFDVSEARNGPEALQLLQTSTPSLIILDLVLPDINGIELLMQLRQDAKHEKIPVIILSSVDLPEEQVQWLNDGSQKVYLKKNFGSKDLVSDIKKVIDEVDKKANDIQNQTGVN